MANSFDTIYTGKGGAVELPSGAESLRQQERLSDLITKGEELRFKVYRENAKEFQANAQIEPEFVLAKSARDYTAKQISEFNQKWGKTFAQKAGQGGLSDEDKLQMTTDKAWIIKKNQDDVATMQRYQTMKQAVYNNPDKYDVDKFLLEEAKYIDEGKFDLTAPPLKALDFSGYLQSKSNSITNEYSMPTEESGSQIINRIVNMQDLGKPDDEVSNFIRRGLMENDQARLGAIEEFKTDPTKEQYLLDMNRDGQIDDKDIDNNAIVRWAVNNPKYRKAAVTQNVTYKNKPGLSSTTTGTMRTFSYGTGTPTKYTPTEAVATTLGTTPYNKYHSFGQFEVYTIPTENIEIQDPNGNATRVTVKNLTAKPTGYDEERDEFTFTVTQNYKSNNTRGNGDQIAIKRSQLPPEFSNIDIMVNGKIVKIKDIVGAATPTQRNVVTNVSNIFGQ